MKHTRVPWDGTQGFGGQLSRSYRYQAFTFFEAESRIRLKVKSKTGKSRMDRADRETETKKTEKNPHTFPTLKYLNLGRLMRCNVCEKYEPFCKKKNDRRNSICFIRYFRPNTSAFDTQTLYQHQSALPYMGCCTLPCSSTKEPMILGPIPQSRWRKKKWMYCPWWWLVMVVTPKMKSGRPII